MKIGVASDTHSREIPKQLIDEFKKVDLIIHAGDFSTLHDYQIFSKLKEVKAVYGNVDDPDVKHKLYEKVMFQVEGVTIGIYHGDGPSQKIIESVSQKFKGDKVDVVVFGHSHHAFNEKINGILYFNPGSPTDLVVAPYRSYGILDVQHNQVTGKIIKIKD